MSHPQLAHSHPSSHLDLIGHAVWQVAALLRERGLTADGMGGGMGSQKRLSNTPLVSVMPSRGERGGMSGGQFPCCAQ